MDDCQPQQRDCTYRQRTYSQTSINFCQQDTTVCKEILLQDICIPPEVFHCQSMHKYWSRLCPTVYALSVNFHFEIFFFWSFSRLILNSRVCRICGLKTNKKHTNKPHKQTSKKITLLTDICFHQINHDKISIYATTLMKTEVKVKM